LQKPPVSPIFGVTFLSSGASLSLDPFVVRIDNAVLSCENAAKFYRTSAAEYLFDRVERVQSHGNLRDLWNDGFRLQRGVSLQ